MYSMYQISQYCQCCVICENLECFWKVLNLYFVHLKVLLFQEKSIKLDLIKIIKTYCIPLYALWKDISLSFLWMIRKNRYNMHECSGGSRIFLGGRQLPKWDYFLNVLPKTARKWKNLDPKGGDMRPWCRPWIRQWEWIQGYFNTYISITDEYS